MQQQISLREINQHLSQYIHAVEEGAEYVITRRGKPVARIVPLVDVEEQRVLTPKQEAALERIKQRLEKGYPLGIGKIDREAMYLERWERNGRS
jgi:prevent-host-death family protein